MDVYDKKCQDFKAIYDQLKTCEAYTLELIIIEVNPNINKERLVVCFVFIVYAKYRTE